MPDEAPLEDRLILEAQQHLENNRLEEAADCCSRSLQLAPGSALAHYALYLRAVVRLNMRDFGGAKADLRAAVRVNPEYAEAYAVLGDIYHEQEKFARSLLMYAKSLKLKPDRAVRAALVEVLDDLIWNDVLPDEALVDRLIESGSRRISMRAHILKAVILRERGESEGALQELDSALSLNRSVPDYNTIIWLEKGLIHSGDADYGMALFCFDRALEFDTECFAAHHCLGNIYSDLSQKEQAVRHYEAALRIAPGCVESLVGLAALIKYENPERSRALLHKALRLSPGNEEARIELDELSYLNGSSDE